MKSIVKQTNKKAAFTIVELLTVMSIIVVLFSLLVPALNMVRRHSKRIKQKAQFHSIGVGLDLYKNEFDGYPESDAYDGTGTSYDYCGAMKLCEAMVGQDSLGFHPSSIFNNLGTNSALTPPYDDLYPSPLQPEVDPVHRENLKARKGPYLSLDGANVNTLLGLYGTGSFGSLGDPADPNGGVVLCDDYPRVRHQTLGRRVGMPILYYKADISKNLHDIAQVALSIYDYRDNHELVDLALPWDTPHNHPMATAGTTPDGDPVDPEIFYENTKDEMVTSIPRPVKSDSYILISAGFDGLYGTEDDVFNFGN